MTQPMSDERLAEIRREYHLAPMAEVADLLAEVDRARAERTEIRAALIRELRASSRFRKAWKSARRGRAQAREELKVARPYIDWLHEQRRAQWQEMDRLAGQVKLLRALAEEALHLRQNGECAPGGTETWHAWDLKAPTVLRALDGSEAGR